MNRRHFNQLLGGGVLGAVSPVLTGCAQGARYEDAIAATWRHSAPRVSGSTATVFMELVRYATLAANSHNTQPWQFHIEPERITILPDLARRCPAVDPDDHHLYVSLGCAAENLLQAAAAHGFAGELSMVAGNIVIDLRPALTVESELFLAIPERQCTRAPYDGKSVTPKNLDLLQGLSGAAVDLRLIPQSQLETVTEYVVAGNSAQMRDAQFMRELVQWIRFSEAEVLSHRDGLFSASSGQPTLPDWLGRLAMKALFTERSENEKYQTQIRSSAGAIAFVAAGSDKSDWVKVGRAYQRFALKSTAMGLKHAFINQPVEVPQVRAQFSSYLGLGDKRPDLLVRFGYGPSLPPSLRRPVQSVLV